jgi:hypothetical protein
MRGFADTLVLFMLAAMFCRALVSREPVLIKRPGRVPNRQHKPELRVIH